MTAVSIEWAEKTWQCAPIFAEVSPHEAAWLRARLRFEALKANAAVFDCEPPPTVAVLLSAAVKVTLHRADSGEVTFAILGHGEVLGADALGETGATEPRAINVATNGLRHPASVTTLQETLLARLSRDDFAACLHTMPSRAHLRAEKVERLHYQRVPQPLQRAGFSNRGSSRRQSAFEPLDVGNAHFDHRSSQRHL